MNHPEEANVKKILNLLQSVYWKGVRREVCEAILAYQKIEHFHPAFTAYERENQDLELSSGNFESFCTLLSKCKVYECCDKHPNILQQQSRGLTQSLEPYVKGNGKIDSGKVHTEALKRAKGLRTYTIMRGG